MLDYATLPMMFWCVGELDADADFDFDLLCHADKNPVAFFQSIPFLV
jgi:hypothetical protein